MQLLPQVCSELCQVADPLNKLTRKNIVFNWDENCQQAFETLKSVLTDASILAYPDFTLNFELYVDASNNGIGMVLGQIQNGKEVVIAYAGCSLNQAERNYSVTEREALSVVEGIKYFQSYLYGRKFTVHTDHNALKWLMQIRDPTGRLARWSLLLQQFDFEIKHRAGKSNGNADALSRRPYDHEIAAFDKPGVQTERIYELQRRDPTLADIIDYLEINKLPSDEQSARAILHTIDDVYLDQDGIICHIWTPGKGRLSTPCSQLVVPTALRHEILLSAHDDPTGGHFGVHKTYEKLRERYYWRELFADVQHWCTTCVSCGM